MVLTRPPSFSRRHGITRARSISGRGETPEKRHAELVALLRVELDAAHAVALDDRREVVTIGSDPRDVPELIALCEVGMHEIEALLRPVHAQERGWPRRPHHVPPHVWHPEAPLA